MLSTDQLRFMSELVDMDTNRLRHLKEGVTYFSGCDPEVAAGVSSFVKDLTPSHTLTSRRYSVWGALRQRLDRAFSRAVASFSGHWDPGLLDGFKPSQAWRLPATHVIDELAKCPEARRQVITIRAKATDRAEVDARLDAMECWEECLRFAVRSASEPGNHRLAELKTFTATLGTMRALLRDLRTLRPRDGLMPSHGRVADRVTRPDESAYCELCWRETMRTKALKSAGATLSKHRLSNRFCEVHDPSSPGSRYRVDLRYKKAFQRELLALYGWAESAYNFRFSPPRSADEAEIRKTAYDLVHSGLRPITGQSMGGASLKERVWRLNRMGLRQADIARDLGVSRQAVSKALKDLEALLRARENDAELCYSTGEALPVSGEEGQAVRYEVVRMLKEGHTVAQIAHRTGRFRHTIDTIIRSAISPPA